MLLLYSVYLCSVFFISVQSLHVRRAFASLTSWTEIGQFCFLPTGGYVSYRADSQEQVNLVLYHKNKDNLTDSDIANSDLENQLDDRTLFRNTLLSENFFTTATIDIESSSGDEYDDNILADSPNEEPCAGPDVKIFRSFLVSGDHQIIVIPKSNHVICLELAIFPRCREINDVKVYVTFTNREESFWWKHISAESISLFLTDLASFGIIVMLVICGALIRSHLVKNEYYAHAVTSCLLSLLTLMVVLAANILLHALFAINGQETGNVHIIIKIFFIASQAMFVQALFLNAVKHTWCNDEAKLEKGYGTTICICSTCICYGLALISIHMFREFSDLDIIAQYALFALQGLTWLVFVVTVLCTVSAGQSDSRDGDKDGDEQKNATLNHQGTLPPPRYIRSLFGDYDYPVSLASPENADDVDTADNEETRTNYTDFDQVVTPTPPIQPEAKWIGIRVSGHYTDISALPLGGCGVLVYSVWFLSVPLLILWSPYLLPPWLIDQCVYGVELLNIILGYVYFLACSVPLKEQVPPTPPEPPATRTVEHLTVI